MYVDDCLREQCYCEITVNVIIFFMIPNLDANVYFP